MHTSDVCCAFTWLVRSFFWESLQLYLVSTPEGFIPTLGFKNDSHSHSMCATFSWCPRPDLFYSCGYPKLLVSGVNSNLVETCLSRFYQNCVRAKVVATLRYSSEAVISVPGVRCFNLDSGSPTFDPQRNYIESIAAFGFPLIHGQATNFSNICAPILLFAIVCKIVHFSAYWCIIVHRIIEFGLVQNPPHPML